MIGQIRILSDVLISINKHKNGETISVNIKGRHDPVIVPRAAVVVESMAALTLADLMLINMSAQADFVTEHYHRT